MSIYESYLTLWKHKIKIEIFLYNQWSFTCTRQLKGIITFSNAFHICVFVFNFFLENKSRWHSQLGGSYSTCLDIVCLQLLIYVNVNNMHAEPTCLTSVKCKHGIKAAYLYLLMINTSGFWQISTARRGRCYNCVSGLHQEDLMYCGFVCPCALLYPDLEIKCGYVPSFVQKCERKWCASLWAEASPRTRPSVFSSAVAIMNAIDGMEKLRGVIT